MNRASELSCGQAQKKVQRPEGWMQNAICTSKYVTVSISTMRRFFA
jgi:hypothetical protein